MTLILYFIKINCVLFIQHKTRITTTRHKRFSINAIPFITLQHTKVQLENSFFLYYQFSIKFRAHTHSTQHIVFMFYVLSIIYQRKNRLTHMKWRFSHAKFSRACRTAYCCAPHHSANKMQCSTCD